MKILTAGQIRQADSHTIMHEPISSIDLMERAASACFEWIIDNFNKDYSFKIFCGTGNNGADGLVIARKLFGAGYNTEVYILRYSETCSEEFLINEKRLEGFKIKVNNINEHSLIDLILSSASDKAIIIDAIFGSGLTRPITGFVAQAVKKINDSGCPVISIDIPSGLFAEDNDANKANPIIKAAYTLTFELPRLSFFFPGSGAFAGEWKIIPIGLDKKFIDALPCNYFFITKQLARGILKHRHKFSHKGTFGHALIIAGEYGKLGAAVLSAGACLRSGVGLCTVHIPRCGYQVIQSAVPEAMVSIDADENLITTVPGFEKYTAIGIGPGIGTGKLTEKAVKLLIQNSKLPIVFDADALNIISENKTWLSFIPPKCIFTPHLKEFDRLTGKPGLEDSERFTTQSEFAVKYNCYVVLKGAHTCIACPDGQIYFNSTGNPGMATGGSGDVLCGIITGLLAQGYTSKESCILGVYLHGLAGDIAAEAHGYEAIIAGDITEHLGQAFQSLRL